MLLRPRFFFQRGERHIRRVFRSLGRELGKPPKEVERAIEAGLKALREFRRRQDARAREVLAGLGLICEVHSGGNFRSYLMRRPSEHHHHLICSNCGKVVDFTGHGLNLGKLEQRLSNESGFRIDNHLLEFVGLCQSCQKEMG